MCETVYSVEVWKLTNANSEGAPFASKEEALEQYRQELGAPYSRGFKYVRLVQEECKTSENGDVEILSSKVLREAIF